MQQDSEIVAIHAKLAANIVAIALVEKDSLQQGAIVVAQIFEDLEYLFAGLFRLDGIQDGSAGATGSGAPSSSRESLRAV